MSPGLRITLVGLAVAVLAVLIGTTVIPTHVTPANGSIRCGTVLHPDRDGAVADLCGPAGAHQLRAALMVGAILAILATPPAFVGRMSRRRRRISWMLWGAVFLTSVVVAVLWLSINEYSPP